MDGETHVIKVSGLVEKPLKLSISDIRNRYKQHEITSALQCAGNRRHTMRTLLKEVNGIDWGDAAVMNCRWKGAKLRDILAEVRPSISAKSGHVAFSCYQTKVQGADWYGASISLDKAMDADADVLVALEASLKSQTCNRLYVDRSQMNGQPLTPNHGFPARIIVPGVSGARSVKWLDEISIQDYESTNLYQRYDYKRLPPEATDPETAKKFWDITPALQDMPVNSAITHPQSGQTVELSGAGTISVSGYALPQGDEGPVVRVEVSADGGETWHDAKIVDGGRDQGKWAWSLWTIELKMQRGKGHIQSRATDHGGNTQPEQAVWNLRGVGYDGYGEARDLVIV